VPVELEPDRFIIPNLTFHTSFNMPFQSFYLLGDDPTSAQEINVDDNASLDQLAAVIASYFAIVVHKGKSHT
jgi:hypothetical protein